MKFLVALFLFFAIPAYAQTTFNRDLRFGDRGSDVVSLQKLLEVTPASGYFGILTLRAVIRFQESHKAEILTPSGLKYGTGYVGKATRAFLNTPTSSPEIHTDASTSDSPSELLKELLMAQSTLYIKNFGTYFGSAGSKVTAELMRPQLERSGVVHWGAIATSSVAIDGSRMVFAVPDIPTGFYDVTVKVPGLRVNYPIIFIVTSPGVIAPRITSVSPSRLSSGTVVELMGTGLDGVSNKIYSNHGMFESTLIGPGKLRFIFSVGDWYTKASADHRLTGDFTINKDVTIQVYNENGVSNELTLNIDN